ncbi:MAG: hypothetical protein MMC33_003286 [Icmadophila ericetorum]|nr:hypothetical protein [Icmadophila ericetorum]
MEWTKKKYNDNYNYYMPWIEDKVLSYWGENKTSYTTKQQLSSENASLTGDKNLNAVQDGIAEGVGGQFSKGGLLAPVGEGVSQEGVNRVERGEDGRKEAKGYGGQVKEGVGSVVGNVPVVGGLVGGGGGKK